ncbi:MAG TPA: hypothetical protein PKI98_06090 [Chitinophagaceae bacterium]|nr:hypothetical protein [Chitinophagaceae bacterium]HNJ58960.1 hypothetical protein [Chitinophagaceae bacterium]HNM34441.1 hypothetical protein [Chitinophagaceae bacterium]
MPASAIIKSPLTARVSAFVMVAKGAVLVPAFKSSPIAVVAISPVKEPSFT